MCSSDLSTDLLAVMYYLAAISNRETVQDRHTDKSESRFILDVFFLNLYHRV